MRSQRFRTVVVWIVVFGMVASLAIGLAALVFSP
jgi:hypothetical protein